MSRFYEEAQIGVIGSLLLDAPHVAGMVFHRTCEGDYTGEFKTVFQAAHRLFLEGKPIDPLTVVGALGNDYGRFVMEIMDSTPTATNVEEYIRLTVEESKHLRLQTIASSMATAATVEEQEELLHEANQVVGGRSHVKRVNMFDGLQAFYDRQAKPARLLSWGIERVNQVLRVELGGDFIVLGGYPSAGKTAFSLQLAWAQAKDLKIGYFSLETKPEKIIDRLVASVCGVDFGRIKAHAMSEEDWKLCSDFSGRFSDRKLDVIQAGGLTVAQIQAISLSNRYDVIYIDYLQLIAPADKRQSAFEATTQISKDLHTMAQTTGITICALSQLTRPEKTGQQEKAPGLHSLRQSGQIEQDADGVMLLYKEEPTNPKSRRCLKIAKNKEGEAGGVLYLHLDGAHQKFYESMVDQPAPQSRERSGNGQEQTFIDLSNSTPIPF